MVHELHPLNSAPVSQTVSFSPPPLAGGFGRLRGPVLSIAAIGRPEFVLGTVEQHPKVPTIDPKRLADFVFALFSKKNGPPQLLVPFRPRPPDRPHRLPRPPH